MITITLEEYWGWKRRAFEAEAKNRELKKQLNEFVDIAMQATALSERRTLEAALAGAYNTGKKQ